MKINVYTVVKKNIMQKVIVRLAIVDLGDMEHWKC